MVYRSRNECPVPVCSEVVVKRSMVKGPKKESSPQRPSRLFLLRVWTERKHTPHGPEDLVGKVQDPVSGQILYFDGGMELVRILHRAISQKEVDRPRKHPDGNHI